MIRLTVPALDESEVQAVREVLLSGYLVQGGKVADFERVVAGYIGTKQGVAVANCTAALHLALLALGVGRGDRVAVTAYSWPATANVIVLCGAEPVFVDIDRVTFNMDPDELDRVLRRVHVKAVLPVHAFGGMADMPRIIAIAAEHGVPVVEDAACALGAEMLGRKAGTWGAIGCFSFHPRKAITTGEGGMITTDDLPLANACRALRNHGLDPECAAPDFIIPGFNLRLTEFQAAIGLIQMDKMPALATSRQCEAQIYDRLLADSEIQQPSVLAGATHVYQSYVVQLPPAVSARRGEIIKRLKERGVETTIGTYHMPATTYFRQQGYYRPGAFPATDDVSARALSLPVFFGMTMEQQQVVVTELMDAM
jgi:dTDP-4-amino-4,6-dideoxygalactose transaminase